MTGHVPVFGNVSPLPAKRVSSVAFLCACHFFCICNMTYGGFRINNTFCVTTHAVRFFIPASVFVGRITSLCFQLNVRHLCKRDFIYLYIILLIYNILWYYRGVGAHF